MEEVGDRQGPAEPVVEVANLELDVEGLFLNVLSTTDFGPRVQQVDL